MAENIKNKADTDTVIERLTTINDQLDRELEATVRKQGMTVEEFYGLADELRNHPADAVKTAKNSIEQQLPATTINEEQLNRPSLESITSSHLHIIRA